jgi:hypothetical protein
MAFERDGDAGTRLATADALRLIATGTGQAVIEMIENAPPGPIETQWGLGFRNHAECVATSAPRESSAGRRRGVAAALHRARGTVVLDRFVERALA